MRLIDADALAIELLSLAYLGCDGGYYKGMADERDDTLQRIKDAPSIDLVNRGKWFFTEYDYFTCSVCGESYFNGAESTAQAECYLEKGCAYSFCPNCGASMRTEESV